MRTIFAAVAALALGAAAPACSRTAAFQQSSPAARGASAADLDRLLAPIALYPDTLIAQILLCAGDPASVTKLRDWLAANGDLQGTARQDAAKVDGFEPSFVALALFPQVVGQMASQIDWTARLGKAFAADRAAVFESIQQLRARAQQSGALADTPQQTVETRTTGSGEQVIVIEPANPQIIYVPQYDPQVVYTQPATTTVVVEQDDDDVDAAVAGVIGFTAGIALGAAIDNDYYYGPYGWHGGVYMYNDAWDDWSDAREDAREDWMDHREELVQERGDRAGDRQQQRTERTEGRQDARGEGQAQRTDRQQTRQESRPAAPASREGRAEAVGTTETRGSGAGYAARGHTDTATAGRDRSGTRSDAFSGYSSGGSERSASARGKSSRGSARSGGGRRR